MVQNTPTFSEIIVAKLQFISNQYTLDISGKPEVHPIIPLW